MLGKTTPSFYMYTSDKKATSHMMLGIHSTVVLVLLTLILDWLVGSDSVLLDCVELCGVCWQISLSSVCNFFIYIFFLTTERPKTLSCQKIENHIVLR